MAHRLVRFALIGSLILLAVSLWRKDLLPDHQVLSEELLVEPAQASIQQPPVETTVGGVTYKIQPLYSYDL
jgi:hypothetical protein